MNVVRVPTVLRPSAGEEALPAVLFSARDNSRLQLGFEDIEGGVVPANYFLFPSVVCLRRPQTPGDSLRLTSNTSNGDQNNCSLIDVVFRLPLWRKMSRLVASLGKWHPESFLMPLGSLASIFRFFMFSVGLMGLWHVN